MLFFSWPWSVDSEPLGNFTASCFKYPTKNTALPSFQQGYFSWISWNQTHQSSSTCWTSQARWRQWELLRRSLSDASMSYYTKQCWVNFTQLGEDWRRFWGLLCVSQQPHVSSCSLVEAEVEVEKMKKLEPEVSFCQREQWVQLCVSHSSK